MQRNQGYNAFARSIIALAVLSLALTSNAWAQTKTVKLDGSSTVFPIAEAVAEEFQTSKSGSVQVTVGVSGTGGGFKKFLRGEIDVINASRPILAGEMEEAKKNGIEYIELPIAFDALTVIVSPKNTFVDSLTVEELKKAWEPSAQGAVTNWKQIRESFPDQPLKLYGAGADSGTFDYFTEAIVGKAKSSRGDYTASEDDNVLVQGVAGDVNALGYFGFSYFTENKDKLKAVPIVSKGGGSAVSPSQEAVLAGSYQPLSRPLFIYANKKSLEKPEVKEFVEFFLNNAAVLAQEVKYVPLPADAYQKGLERVKAVKVGTVFGGHADVGVKIAELFTRELKS